MIKWRETSTQESQIKTVEGELVLLKQRQAERKKEREIEEREFAERRRQVCIKFKC